MSKNILQCEFALSRPHTSNTILPCCQAHPAVVEAIIKNIYRNSDVADGIVLQLMGYIKSQFTLMQDLSNHEIMTAKIY